MRNVRALKADPNFSTIDAKQGYIGALRLCVKVSFSVGNFSIFCVVSTNETKMYEIEWLLLKGEYKSRELMIKL